MYIVNSVCVCVCVCVCVWTLLFFFSLNIFFKPTRPKLSIERNTIDNFGGGGGGLTEERNSLEQLESE